MNRLRHIVLDLAGFLAGTLKLHRLVCPYTKGEGLILVMHRVLPERSCDRIPANSRIEIRPEFLEKLIKYFLHLGYEIISLDGVYERLTRGIKGSPFVSFTFDDGYADIYDIIYPVFKKYQAPFAVYVVTDFPDRKAVLWWYMLEDLVLGRDELCFAAGGRRFNYRTDTMAGKEKAYAMIRELLLFADNRQMKKLLAEIFAPFSISPEDYEGQQMSWQQIAELARDPLVTIGAHTVHHHNLSRLTADEVREEIISSRDILTNKTGRPVRHFAYPFGSRAEVGEREIAIGAECGFRIMVTVREGTVFSAHVNHLSCLPRVEITGNHQNLGLVDIRRCGLVAMLRNRMKRLVTL